MIQFSANRKNIGIGIGLFFVLSTTFLYGFYSTEINAEISMASKITVNDSSLYKGFNYTVKNNEDKVLEPVFYAIGPRQRGEVIMHTNISEVAPNESDNLIALLANGRDPIPPSGDYILILKDKETGRLDSRIMSFNNGDLSEKNPYFTKISGYRSHWKGSIYGNGYYNMSMKNKGLNASFQNCRSTCGFTYRDRYRLTDRLTITGIAEGLGNNTDISAVVADKEFDINVEEDANGTQRFEKKINLTEHFDSHNREEVTYEIQFKSEKKEFHWTQINQYRFYNPE